jgi:hypothetical protein
MSNALNEMPLHGTPGAVLPDAATIESALSMLPDVCGSRVVVEAGAGIKELHVIAAPRRAPKKIIRDIESLLLVQYSYRIDYRRISLAQIGDGGSAPRDHVTLGRVDQTRTAQGEFVEVELFDGQHPFHGSCQLEGDPAYAAGVATVSALNELFVSAAPLTLCGVQCSIIGMRHVVTVYVKYNETEHLLGTAFVRSSIAAATARAVLAATNRRMSDWVQSHSPVGIAGMVAA